MGRKPSIAPAFAVATGFLLFASGHADAEFEIPEVDVEKGGVEAEYRGAGHWGLPDPSVDGDLEALRQSHEIELQYGLTNWWALRVTPNVEQPDGEATQFVALGLETQFVLKPRNDGAFGLAFMAGYSPVSLFADLEQPDEFEFGPVVEIAGNNWLLTLNPRLFREIGEHAEQDWLGAEYAGQVEYRVNDRWSAAALMFGEIEDLAAPGGFNDQAHILGPGIYLYSPGNSSEADVEGARWSLGIGALFGLTDNVADTTLRVTFAVER